MERISRRINRSLERERERESIIANYSVKFEDLLEDFIHNVRPLMAGRWYKNLKSISRW